VADAVTEPEAENLKVPEVPALSWTDPLAKTGLELDAFAGAYVELLDPLVLFVEELDERETDAVLLLAVAKADEDAVA
jgi:hypothetical protein